MRIILYIGIPESVSIPPVDRSFFGCLFLKEFESAFARRRPDGYTVFNVVLAAFYLLQPSSASL
jgi:hypothetical protein